MQRYLTQLLEDIVYATENVAWPFAEKESYSIWEVVPDEDEEKTAPIRSLEEWTGIKKEMLPPAEMLNDEEMNLLLEALKKMLDAYNWSFVMQIQVPERIQYAAIRDVFDQDAKVKQWNMGFFELCRPGTTHGKCALGEYCHCAFFAEMFKDLVDEELTPEEERKRMLDIEVQHIKKKYGDDWMKYYPYHLDSSYDDENGNPYDYGFGDDEFDEEDEDDNWWRK